MSRRFLRLQSRSNIPHTSGGGGGVAMPWPQAPVQGSCGSGVILGQSWGMFLWLDFVPELVKVWPLLSGCSRSSRVLEKPHGVSQERRPEGRRGGMPCLY